MTPADPKSSRDDAMNEGARLLAIQILTVMDAESSKGQFAQIEAVLSVVGQIIESGRAVN